MSWYLIRLHVLVFFTLAVGACQTLSFGEPSMQLEWSQYNAMHRILADVKREMRTTMESDGGISLQDAQSLMVSHDPEVRAILNEDQWQHWTSSQREYFTAKTLVTARERSPLRTVSNIGESAYRPQPAANL